MKAEDYQTLVDKKTKNSPMGNWGIVSYLFVAFEDILHIGI